MEEFSTPIVISALLAFVIGFPILAPIALFYYLTSPKASASAPEGSSETGPDDSVT
jgi:hypothetical protein